MIEFDKEKLESRGKQQICRLDNSSTHSYFIFDSSRFMIAKEMFYDFKSKDKSTNSDGPIEANLSAEVNQVESVIAKAPD